MLEKISNGSIGNRPNGWAKVVTSFYASRRLEDSRSRFLVATGINFQNISGIAVREIVL